jgi:hypothetical protein
MQHCSTAILQSRWCRYRMGFRKLDVRYSLVEHSFRGQRTYRQRFVQNDLRQPTTTAAFLLSSKYIMMGLCRLMQPRWLLHPWVLGIRREFHWTVQSNETRENCQSFYCTQSKLSAPLDLTENILVKRLSRADSLIFSVSQSREIDFNETSKLLCVDNTQQTNQKIDDDSSSFHGLAQRCILLRTRCWRSERSDH